MQVLSQKLLPRYGLTRLFGKLGECKINWFKNFFINRFIKLYKIDLAEAEISDYKEFKSFNEFFSRRLKPSARVVDPAATSITAPVDGFIYDFGTMPESMPDKPMFSAKGFEFSLNDLVVKKTTADLVGSGTFICMYLSPKDYHRVHMPVTGRLIEMLYVPGDYYSVSPKVLKSIPKIFAKNERIICTFDTEQGPMVYLMIGAMNVSSIHTVWAGAINASRQGKVIQTCYRNEEIILKKGEELGHFQMGSTVIVLFAKDTAKLSENLRSGQHCLYGEKIGTVK